MPGVKGVPHKNRKQQPWYHDCFAYRPYQRDDNGDIGNCRVLKEAYCKCSEKCNIREHMLQSARIRCFFVQRLCSRIIVED